VLFPSHCDHPNTNTMLLTHDSDRFGSIWVHQDANGFAFLIGHERIVRFLLRFERKSAFSFDELRSSVSRFRVRIRVERLHLSAL
jgi:hypothetical protein